jgi:hypothetical protein
MPLHGYRSTVLIRGDAGQLSKNPSGAAGGVTQDMEQTGPVVGPVEAVGGPGAVGPGQGCEAGSGAGQHPNRWRQTAHGIARVRHGVARQPASRTQPG